MSDKSIPIPKELPILPVRDTVLFPGGVQPLTVAEVLHGVDRRV